MRSRVSSAGWSTILHRVLACATPAALLLGCGAPPDVEAPLGGAAQAVGVPLDACGEGFVSDGNGGCEAILPPAACPKGTMAVPGMTKCEEVAPCGSGTWGNIPVEANTQYVDQAYKGSVSDGSSAMPWTTIQQAVDAAAPFAIVAVAAGSYAEHVVVNKQVRLWGRCPALVEVAEGLSDPVSISIGGGVFAEIHDLGITGGGVGVEATQASFVVLERVWIHDTESRGINALGGASVVVRRSLIERAHDAGVSATGAKVTLYSTNLRDTQPGALPDGGRGVQVDTSVTAAPSDVTILRSSLERNHREGVIAFGGHALIESTVVRDTQPDALGNMGYGIAAVEDAGGSGATLLVQKSLISGNGSSGVLVVGSSATIESSTVRDTKADTHGMFGRGIDVEFGKHNPATATIESCLLERSQEAGLFVAGAGATVAGTLIRDTGGGSAELGDGIMVVTTADGATVSKVSVTASRVEGSHRAGIASFGNTVLISGATFSCNAVDLDREDWLGNVATFEEGDDNACGCPAVKGECKAVSAGLKPPKALWPMSP